MEVAWVADASMLEISLTSGVPKLVKELTFLSDLRVLEAGCLLHQFK